MPPTPYMPRHAKPSRCQHCCRDIREREPGRWEDADGFEVCVKYTGPLPGTGNYVTHTPMPVVRP